MHSGINYEEGKTWPELVGANSQQAVELLLRQGYEPIVIKEDDDRQSTANNMNLKRVYLFVDEHNRISREPING
ncbi:unnamed protein product [Didymodactylos carnosus]|uniref:Uncharacterized protein n=1 Tax=Didymodactylos carnosus TaxID=1234261 RepID=A0A813XZ36_9BILA|nr:unnamed protein product [Didymodactylos carnosus]CAF1394719.1 unnamed protein product [Didymodactylos carnosus]CAF3661205.1 unnamed protein product [Didymodactylos carnosus]CAF4202127.1 unnamed protein product [Didymodactylos carnosus]